MMLFADDSTNFIVELLKGGGLMGFLALLLTALWKIALWVRDNVVTPLTKSHLELIEELKKNIPDQTTAIKQIKNDSGEHRKLLGNIAASNERIADTTMRLSEQLTRQNQIIEEHHAWSERAIANAHRAIEQLPCKLGLVEIDAKKTDEMPETEKPHGKRDKR